MPPVLYYSDISINISVDNVDPVCVEAVMVCVTLSVPQMDYICSVQGMRMHMITNRDLLL